ncbi:MAG: hypothetical protein H0V27_04485 [Pyrinomonadaceae bacterium]|nr:hypothetical protein [Pyrinomonadaceae bacterium]
MNYPLHVSFKILAIARQLSVTDASGNLLAYAKQKAFKLKEAVTIFADAEQTRPLYTANAEKILDFSGRYNFADARTGHSLGSVKRQGMKSLWKAHYDIFDETHNANLTIREENAWIKVFDSLLGEVPVVGMFSGYLFHPAYLVQRADGTTIMRLEKQPAFLEGKFRIDKQAEMSQDEETRALLSLIMMILLERSRG